MSSAASVDIIKVEPVDICESVSIGNCNKRPCTDSCKERLYQRTNDSSRLEMTPHDQDNIQILGEAIFKQETQEGSNIETPVITDFSPTNDQHRLHSKADLEVTGQDEPSTNIDESCMDDESTKSDQLQTEENRIWLVERDEVEAGCTSVEASGKRLRRAVLPCLKTFRCSECNFVASRQSRLKRHVFAVHLGFKPHKCEMCDYRASQPSLIKDHVLAVHSGLKPHKCTICDYSASRLTHIKDHILAVHSGLKPHQCTKCDYRAARKPHLTRHMLVVHPDVRPFNCTICDHSASRLSLIKKHILAVHPGLKPHQCTLCEYSASRQSHLKEHILAVHSGLKPHQCTKCNYSASQKSHLTRHILTVHSDLLPTEGTSCISNAL